MKGDLILVIDMQNAYDADGAWECHNIKKCTENIVKILENRADGDVILTKYTAPENPVGVWREYNVVNESVNNDAYANELIKDFIPYADKYTVCEKSTYSCMSRREIREAVKYAKRVVLTGVVAECCVLSTAMSLIDAGCYVVYVKDAVAGISQETCDATELVLRGLDYLHTKILTTEEYLGEAETITE